MNAHQAKKPATQGTQFGVPVLRAFEAAARSGTLRLYRREGLEFAVRGAEGTLADFKKKVDGGKELTAKEKRLQARLVRIQSLVSAVLAEGPMP